MKIIQILGSGCSKCNQFSANVKQAADDAGIAYKLEKVTDMLEIAKMGVMSPPGLVIDGEIKSMGKLLTPEQISKYLVD